jgi:glycogen(starch) synthase
MVHTSIGNQSSIAKISAWGVRQALKAGWRVTVVANDLDESLRADVEWLPLYVPPRLFLVRWLAARRAIQAAIGGRTFDVVHVHQAQAAAIADVMQCHFLTRAAYERHCLEDRKALKPMLNRAQQQGVLHAEDYYYRRWNPRTRMLFDSELTRQDFCRLYGEPARQQVFLYAAPAFDPPSAQDKARARAELVGDHPGPVLGYLGGVDNRKGYRRLIRALEGDSDVFLLMGGPNSAGFAAPALGRRFKSVGMVKDLATFYAACDAFVIPSHYEPFGLVALEAAARGVPVIATDEVGALPHVLEYGAGLRWDAHQSLPGLVAVAASRRASLEDGARRVTADLSEANQGRRLLQIYEDVLREKGRLSERSREEEIVSR